MRKRLCGGPFGIIADMSKLQSRDVARVPYPWLLSCHAAGVAVNHSHGTIANLLNLLISIILFIRLGFSLLVSVLNYRRGWKILSASRPTTALSFRLFRRCSCSFANEIVSRPLGLAYRTLFGLLHPEEILRAGIV